MISTFSWRNSGRKTVRRFSWNCSHETNFTDSDSNWVFGAVNKHLRQRGLRETVFLRKEAAAPCGRSTAATSGGLSWRLRFRIATEYVHLE
jgi:hypothetical protein